MQSCLPMAVPKPLFKNHWSLHRDCLSGLTQCFCPGVIRITTVCSGFSFSSETHLQWLPTHTVIITMPTNCISSSIMCAAVFSHLNLRFLWFPKLLFHVNGSNKKTVYCDGW